jgi:hypothetical protein
MGSFKSGNKNVFNAVVDQLRRNGTLSIEQQQQKFTKLFHN